MTTKATPQTAMDERTVDNRELEKALEDREQAKGGAAEARAKFNTLDEVVKDKVEDFDLADGEVARVGRFRIEKKRVAPREVSFTAEATSRLSIKPDAEE
jgi:hypothetical protein